MHRQSLLRSALLALITFVSATALAAEAPQTAGATNIDVSGTDIQQFAEAHKGIMEVRREYVGKAKSIEDKEKMKQLKIAMQKDMLAAVKESGMEPKRYNQVARQVAQDKELQQRVQQELTE